MTTYKIVRFYSPAHENHPDNYKVVRTGLTLEEAEEHCSDPTTRVEGVWFDGYNEEE